MVITNDSLAENMEGMKLQNGWNVLEKIDNKQSPDDTGGNFSVGYKVLNDDGTEGFLKAINLPKMVQDPTIDRTAKIAQVMNDYNFEKNVLERCYNKRMKHIIKMLDSGEAQKEEYPVFVPYLIFEFAPSTIRKQISRITDQVNVLLNMKWLHSITVGMQELHKADIAHLDLKPSNVLIDKDDKSKITDFGRSLMKGGNYIPSHHNLPFPGDKTYAPIEYLYHEYDLNTYDREIGADFYMLGSLIYQFFSGISMTQSILNKIPEAFWPSKGFNDYAQVKPYVINAYANVMNEFSELINNKLDDKFKSEIYYIVNEMCTPIKEERGDPERIKRKSPKYDLERYITRLDVIVRKMELTLVGRKSDEH